MDYHDDEEHASVFRIPLPTETTYFTSQELCFNCIVSRVCLGVKLMKAHTCTWRIFWMYVPLLTFLISHKNTYNCTSLAYSNKWGTVVATLTTPRVYHLTVKLTEAFLVQYFPPSKILPLRDEIINFRQIHREPLCEEWGIF